MKNALISVTDKRGLVELCSALAQSGWSIFATSGTKKMIDVFSHCQSVEAVTEFPEIMDGRIKTLHPKIFAGILAQRESESDMAEVRRHGVFVFDLVVVNLYAFSQYLEKTIDEQAAHIDIGGPSLIRAAAKNWKSVCVLTDPDDYPRICQEIPKGPISKDTRRELAIKAFRLTSEYDALIARTWEQADTNKIDAKAWALRYGENPHQTGSFNATKESNWHALQGKKLSYNNLLDAHSSYRLVCDFSVPAVAIIKHTNPCGVAAGENPLLQLFKDAFATDSQSAFGGIVAFNRVVDAPTALEMKDIFLEVIIAPQFSGEAQSILGAKQNLRLIEWPNPRWPAIELRSAMGGLLTQSGDDYLGWDKLKVVTVKPLPPEKLADLHMAWIVAKHAKSNAIVVARGGVTLGVGAGQMSRVESVEIALKKSANKGLSGAVLASDAFFPFRDNIERLKNLGIAAIVQPGGSQRDNEVIKACDEYGIAMAFTSVRHFRH